MKKIIYVLLVSLVIIQPIEAKVVQGQQKPVQYLSDGAFLEDLIRFKPKVIVLYDHENNPDPEYTEETLYNFRSIASRRIYGTRYQEGRDDWFFIFIHARHIINAYRSERITSAPTFEIYVNSELKENFTDYGEIQGYLNQY